ncbi:hypothetical protein QR98_0018730 [Sarcoptes scabiei]|uniref:Uncharacterized protein n=1 Tax=Sarcoptes scabiei TaxID=52283 RepID=A0A131ZXN8_SARSC|nr:hypothetical protein QR98_0018730 [Sarcoptes scabiei]
MYPRSPRIPPRKDLECLKRIYRVNRNDDIDKALCDADAVDGGYNDNFTVVVFVIGVDSI